MRHNKCSPSNRLKLNFIIHKYGLFFLLKYIYLVYKQKKNHILNHIYKHKSRSFIENTLRSQCSKLKNSNRYLNEKILTYLETKNNDLHIAQMERKLKPGKREKEIVKNGRMKSENELRTFGTENHNKGKIKKIKQYQKNLKERGNEMRRKKKRKAVNCRV